MSTVNYFKKLVKVLAWEQKGCIFAAASTARHIVSEVSEKVY